MLKSINGKNIEIIIKDEKIELPQEINVEIQDFWDKAKAENPNIWNGEIMCVSDYKNDENNILITCKKTNFAHHLYDERMNMPKEYACSNLSAGCLLETIDNYYIIGELASDTSFPYCLQISGGNVDDEDIQDGKIDIFNTITRECKEELNINLKNKKQVENFELKYIRLPSKDIRTYVIFAKGNLNMTKKQMEEYYEQYLKYLKENNLEIEFSQIHFIPKSNIKELENLNNPKRDYLKRLLELESAN